MKRIESADYPRYSVPTKLSNEWQPTRQVPTQPRRLVDTCSITLDGGGNYVTRDEEQTRATRDNSTKMHNTKLLSFPLAGGPTTRPEVSSSQDFVCDITSGEPGHSVVKMPRCLPGGQSVICLDCCAYPWPGGNVLVGPRKTSSQSRNKSGSRQENLNGTRRRALQPKPQVESSKTRRINNIAPLFHQT